jgi:hypothetical protein
MRREAEKGSQREREKGDTTHGPEASTHLYHLAKEGK